MSLMLQASTQRLWIITISRTTLKLHVQIFVCGEQTEMLVDPASGGRQSNAICECNAICNFQSNSIRVTVMFVIFN